MTTISGLLTYVPASGDQRVTPVAPAADPSNRQPRRDPARLSLVPTRGGDAAARAGLDAAVVYALASMPRRRGLKAETSERNRYHNAYARPLDSNAPPPREERRA